MFRSFTLTPLLILCLMSQGCSEENTLKSATSTSESGSKAKPESKPDSKLKSGSKSTSKHELYLQWHDQCLSGKTKDIDTQINRYEARLKADAHDQLARVYLGSAYAQRAKASFWGPTKLKYLKRGQGLMDDAVKATPHDPLVRMVRAIGSYRVPKRFNRRKIAVADFEILVPIATDTSSGLKTNERQAILYYAWLTFKEEEHRDAHKAKTLCHQLKPESKYGKLTTP